MPSIAIQEAFVAISAADALGNLTVTATDYLFPGALANVTKDDGSAQMRVKILARLSATQIRVRQLPGNSETLNGFTAMASGPSYGLTSMTAFNGASHICQEPQNVPVDPAFSVRVVP